MATVSINIPDEHATDVLNVLALHWNYDPGSGLTQAQFVKSKIAEVLKNTYMMAKAEASATTARETTRTTVSAINIT
jgi:hypothetical protein